MQRKSHLMVARQPSDQRPSEWRQPLWVAGFLIFLLANIGGTVFQIGALPIIMMAPLGAVSLLYNALLAKFLLHDILGPMMIGGTALILVGAVFVGYFGAISEPPHPLEQLLVLFGRPPFIVFATILLVTVLCVLAIAHLAEWQLYANLQALANNDALRKSKSKKSHKKHSKLARRWSALNLAPLDEVSETTSGVATPILEVRDQEGRSASDSVPTNFIGPGMECGRSHQGRKDSSYGAIIPVAGSRLLLVQTPSLQRTHNEYLGQENAEAVMARTRLLLSVAYAAVSGTLSGVCLLLAKSGVELLVLTFGTGGNQFNRLGSWALLCILIAAALAQLWYLNKALRMADPTLICPLAFCFYNTSSIALGLVYFDQVSVISATSLTLVILGIVLLLAGVLFVSMKPLSIHEVLDASQDRSLTQVLVSSPTSFGSSPTGSTGMSGANAGVIAEPYLPPTASFLSESDVAQCYLQAPLRWSQSSSGGKPRSASHGGSVAGLGLYLSDFNGRGFLNGSENDPLSPRKSPPNRTCSSSSSMTSESDGFRLADDNIGRASPSLYQSILQRGLSIGLSPSSPGFHVGILSTRVEDDEQGSGKVDARSIRDLARFQRLRGARRIYSEADADGLVAAKGASQRRAKVCERRGESGGGGEGSEGEWRPSRINAALHQDDSSQRQHSCESPSSSALQIQLPSLYFKAVSHRLRSWWLRNVYGYEDWREHERGRLLEDIE